MSENRTETRKQHILNTDKIENLEDCKKILKFLCNLSMHPISNDATYNGFKEVKEYFD